MKWKIYWMLTERGSPFALAMMLTLSARWILMQLWLIPDEPNARLISFIFCVLAAAAVSLSGLKFILDLCGGMIGCALGVPILFAFYLYNLIETGSITGSNIKIAYLVTLCGTTLGIAAGGYLRRSMAEKRSE